MTLQVDFDQDLWVYVPAEWPWEGFASMEQWRDTLVDALADAYSFDEPLRAWVSDVITGIVRSMDEGEHRFAYLSRPHEALAIASIYEWARTEATSEQLLGVDDPRALRAPVVKEFAGGRLGAGMKALRNPVDETDANTVSVVAHWVWRLPDRDVVMIVGDSDLPRFDALHDDFDALARAIGIVPDDERSAQ